MIFLHSWDHDIILGRRFVAMMSGNTSRRPRSDHISQEVSESRMNFCFGSFSTDVVSTSLTKLMNFFSFFYPLFFFRSFSARSLSNWLCLHLYQPCVKQTLYNDKTCSRVPLFQQSSMRLGFSFLLLLPSLALLPFDATYTYKYGIGLAFYVKPDLELKWLKSSLNMLG